MGGGSVLLTPELFRGQLFGDRLAGGARRGGVRGQLQPRAAPTAGGPEHGQRRRAGRQSRGARGGTSAPPGRHPRNRLAPSAAPPAAPAPTWLPGGLRARPRGGGLGKRVDCGTAAAPAGARRRRVFLGAKGLSTVRPSGRVYLPAVGVWSKHTRASWATEPEEPPRTPDPCAGWWKVARRSVVPPPPRLCKVTAGAKARV